MRSAKLLLVARGRAEERPLDDAFGRWVVSRVGLTGQQDCDQIKDHFGDLVDSAQAITSDSPQFALEIETGKDYDENGYGYCE